MDSIKNYFSRITYLIPIFLIPVAGFLGSYLSPGNPLIKGQELTILLPYLMAGMALMLWLRANKNYPWSKIQVLFLVTLIIAWLIETASTQLDQYIFNITAFLLPLAIVMILFKRTSQQSLQMAFLVMLYSLAAISLFSLIFGSLGLTSDGFSVGDSASSRIPLFGDLFGISTRWGGAFGSVNYAGPVGGLLIVCGLTLKGYNKHLLVTSGIVILMLSQARTSVVAVIAALIMMALFSQTIRQSKFRMLFSISLLILPTFLIALSVAIMDPTMSDRTPIWSNFVQLFLNNPLLGAGTSGILEFVNNQAAQDPLITFIHTKAHNVYLDIGARHGLVLLLPTLVLITVPLILASRRVKLDSGKSLAIVIYIVVAGLGDTIYSWQYLNVYILTLLYVVASQRALNAGPLPAELNEENYR